MHPHFLELLHILTLTSAAVRVRYSRYLSLLRLICSEESAKLHTDYSTLFSRLYAVCSVHGLDHRATDALRRRARKVLFENYEPHGDEEERDVASLADFVAQVYGEEVPEGLPRSSRRKEGEDETDEPVAADGKENFRAVVKEVGRNSFVVMTDRCDLEVVPADERVLRLLEKGVVVSLVDVNVEGAGRLQVRTVVLEPDFLLDVSSLAACLRPYGDSPLNYLLSKFAAVESTAPILMGNAANEMMDSVIYAGGCALDDTVYRRSLRRNFEQYVLDYTALPAEQAGAAFFEEMARQFAHIREAVEERFPSPEVDIPADRVVLEPAFLCPALGLRARFDVMTEDFRRIVELKSGRAHERRSGEGTQVAPRAEHVMQMNLYREILRVNFRYRWDEVRAFLFYSRYPEFFNERPSAAAIRDIMHLRNRIVGMERSLMKGGLARLLPLFTTDRINERGLDDRFYHNYLYPQIEAVTRPLREMDELTRAYFVAFVTFVEREQFMAKTTDLRPDSQRGFAASWTADLTTKQLAGNILVDLRLQKTVCTEERGVEVLHFALPDYGDRFMPNFNEGEMVQLYVRDEAGANMTNRQLTRAYIERLSVEELVLRLAYPQHNARLFVVDECYAVEHDYSDAPFAQAYRGLFALVSALPRRRALVLGQERPQRDMSRRLLGDYDEGIAGVVLAAKQASDYFLLVGPPGTGKTNVALKAMVQEHLLSMEHEGEGPLLLMAYTNRAVDEICDMLDDLVGNRVAGGEAAFDYLRLGHEQSCGEGSLGHLLSKRAVELSNRAVARQLLCEVPVVVGTVMALTSASTSLFRLRRFSTAIIDEASQLLEPYALTLLSARDNEGGNAIGKFVLVGDHKQLPAVVMLPPEQTVVSDPALRAVQLLDLRNSLFERLHALQTVWGTEGIVAQLNRHGRMHPDICRFVNRHFYAGRLEAVPLPHQVEGLAWQGAEGAVEELVAHHRVAVVDVKQEPHAENVRANLPEARAVGALVEAVCSLSRKNGQALDAASQIGVIVPFRNQIGLVRRVLAACSVPGVERMTIDTVECFQGSQRDFIIFSTTVSRPYQLHILSQLQRVGEAVVDRKLNVALSRARKQLFLVGDVELLRQSEIYRQFIAESDAVLRF